MIIYEMEIHMVSSIICLIVASYILTGTVCHQQNLSINGVHSFDSYTRVDSNKNIPSYNKDRQKSTSTKFYVPNNPFDTDLLRLPIVITTWNYTTACVRAFEALENKKSSIKAVVNGISYCEHDFNVCKETVGFGARPDENGEVTLDAMIMDGNLMKSGAVGALPRVKNAIGVALKVLENTKHTLLVGEKASEFASKMGFPVERLESFRSYKDHSDWLLRRNCQPNFWLNVVPDSKKSCGPYFPATETSTAYYRNKTHDHGFHNRYSENFNRSQTESSGNKNYDSSSIDDDDYRKFNDHDSIGLIAIDEDGNIAVGSSSNGHAYKIPGRVGDAAIVGASAYADSQAGAAVATGDGDVIQQFSPSIMAVEKLRSGLNPFMAARQTIERIQKVKADFYGAIIVANSDGEYSASCAGVKHFPFTVMNNILKKPYTFWIKCLSNSSENKSSGKTKN